MTATIATEKEQKRIEDIANVQLSQREEHGEYVTYIALSRDGVTTYRVTLRDGKATGCTCPARVKCIHKCAAEFEEVWSAPIAEDELTEEQVAAVAEAERQLAVESELVREQAAAVAEVERQLAGERAGSCSCCGRLVKEAGLCGKCLS